MVLTFKQTIWKVIQISNIFKKGVNVDGWVSALKQSSLNTNDLNMNSYSVNYLYWLFLKPV